MMRPMKFIHFPVKGSTKNMEVDAEGENAKWFGLTSSGAKKKNTGSIWKTRQYRLDERANETENDPEDDDIGKIRFELRQLKGSLSRSKRLVLAKASSGLYRMLALRSQRNA